jgi:hypothetical protein
MPFTSPELVRAHLSGLRAGTLPVVNIPVVLHGTAATQLPHAGLADGSVVVKTVRLDAPIRERLTPASEWVALSHGYIVERTALVAADESLSVVYVENVDYLIDYSQGRFKRIPEGSIPSDQDIVIWYDYYHVYTEGDDYNVDVGNGLLTRRTTGAIADGQTVMVDYTVAFGAITDAVIEGAIAEVDDAVLALLDPRYHDRPAPGIVIGETHWAIAAICRMRAAATLVESATISAGTHNVARVWLDLADRYERSGRERLKRFASPQTSLRSARRR